MVIFRSVIAVQLRWIIIFCRVARKLGFVISAKSNIFSLNSASSVEAKKSENTVWGHRNLHKSWKNNFEQKVWLLSQKRLDRQIKFRNLKMNCIALLKMEKIQFWLVLHFWQRRWKIGPWICSWFWMRILAWMCLILMRARKIFTSSMKPFSSINVRIS